MSEQVFRPLLRSPSPPPFRPFHDHDHPNTHNVPYNTFLCRALS